MRPNMKQFIENIYETRSVVGQAGQIHKLHSEIDRKEGAFLFSIIQDDPTIYNTLEVGCAYGLSSLHICAATKDRAGASHTVIDPFQNTQWDGAGIRNLKTAGIDFFNLIEIIPRWNHAPRSDSYPVGQGSCWTFWGTEGYDIASHPESAYECHQFRRFRI